MVVEEGRLSEDVMLNLRSIERDVDRMAVDHREDQGAVPLLPPTLLSQFFSLYRRKT